MSPALIPLLRSLPAASPLGFDLNARHCLALDLSAGNPRLDSFDPLDTARFSTWIDQEIAAAGANYAAGGYGEDRALYRMSEIFAAADGGHRTVHLGIDLWAPAGTTVYSVLDGHIHSLADNAAFGDYGPTVIVEHA
ncbi:MAG: peptidase M23, partial [Pseudomonadota bacterium]|nr:peptidase M23 [Pseudomonadota bacterium]